MRFRIAGELKIVQDATCTFCGCVCDDIDLTVQGQPHHRGQAGLRAGQGVVSQSSHRRPAELPHQGPAGVARRGLRAGRRAAHVGQVPDRLRPERFAVRSAARGRQHRRLDRRHDRHDDQRLPRAVGHGVSGRGRSDLLAGRGGQPRRPDHVLGLEPGRKPSAALHQVQPDAQGHVSAQRPQGPHVRDRRRAEDQERQGGRHLHSDQAAAGFRGPVDAAGAGQGRRARRRRRAASKPASSWPSGRT